MTADKIIDGVGDTQGWNRYSYCKGNPIQYKDPTGHGILEDDVARDEDYLKKDLVLKNETKENAKSEVDKLSWKAREKYWDITGKKPTLTVTNVIIR